MKMPMDARCVFINGPLALYCQDATPESLRAAFTRLERYLGVFISEMDKSQATAQMSKQAGPKLGTFEWTDVINGEARCKIHNTDFKPRDGQCPACTTIWKRRYP